MHLYKQIIKKAKKCKYISFDIFDTLLIRYCNEAHNVFEYIEARYKIKNFKNKRIKAEQRARELSKEEEITIAEIYDNYMPDDNDFTIEELIKLEINTEKQLLTKNNEIFEIYKKLKKNGYKIIVTSDMYLPHEIINEILHENGYENFEKIYLSSEIKKTKSTGSLFKHILEDLNIKNSEIIHIGDNIKSDFIRPKLLGIKSLKINKRANKNKKIELLITERFIECNNIQKTNDYFSEFGYKCFGPFLFEYIKWLKKMTEKEEIKKIYFLSRDGYIMKKGFDICFPETETHYLEVSRRSLRVPILHLSPEYENIIKELSDAKSIKLINFFDTIGLDYDNYKKIFEENNFSLEKNYEKKDLINSKVLKKLYNKYLKKDVIENSKEEFETLKEYLTQENVNGKFAIVDIGWGGSMQKYLTNTLDVLKIPNDIYGYYIGVADYYKKNNEKKEMQMFGYLFDFKNNQNEKDLRKPFVGLFESLFLEKKGSVAKYKRFNNSIVATRLEYEYFKKDNLIDEEECVGKIQNSAIDFIKCAKSNDVMMHLKLNGAEAFKKIEKIGISPNKNDVERFGDFRFFDEGETNRLAKPKSLFFYMLNIKKFIDDFLNSRWKIGFLKRVFKIRISYYRLYKMLYKFK